MRRCEKRNKGSKPASFKMKTQVQRDTTSEKFPSLEKNHSPVTGFCFAGN